MDTWLSEPIAMTPSSVCFRARAEAGYGAGLRQRRCLVEVHVRRMHEAPVFTDVEVLQQPPYGAPAIARQALIHLALLLRYMDVQRNLFPRGNRRDGGQ